MRIFFLTFLGLLFSTSFLNAQIINGQDTLYGNEWINYNQSYFKIQVADDGIYRLSTQALNDAGFPIDAAPGSQLQLFHNGEEVPMYVTTPGIFSSGDYLEFFGRKNTSELDRYLFKNPEEEMMNPRYSLFTDSAAYFLTWSPAATAPMRYETVANDLVNLPVKEAYFMYEHVLNYFSHFKKKQNSQGVSSSDFGVTEGFSNNFSNSKSYNINPPAVFQGGPDAELYIRYSANSGLHQQQITLNNETLATDEFYDYELRQLTFPLSNTTISGGAMSLKFQGLASNTDNHRVSNIVLTYPRLFNFSNQKKFIFEIDASTGVRYLEISNFSSSGGTPVLYDLTNRIRLTASVTGNLVKIALPPSAEKRKLILVNDVTGTDIPGNPQPVDFIDYRNVNAQFIFLSNSRLYDDGNGNNRVQEYADYRQSPEGGNFSTVIVDIQQLYDQYAWGLNRHPLSIRNFSHFVKKHWDDVQYFFIVGKGREYPNIRTPAQLADASNATFFVPTFGVPGSDNLLLSTNWTSTPIFPLGRLAASTSHDIEIYLKKVKDFEANVNVNQTIEEKQWMKNIIHLGGGGIAAEQGLIKNYLSNMQGIIENNLFGGNVSSFYKTSTDPIQVSKSEQIFERINNGVSIITFFGHSAVGTFDFNIDNPDNYNNYGKYPVLFSLGCYSGNIHTAGLGISERFLFQEDKAAMGMVATTGQGYVSSLYSVMSRFYENLGGAYYQNSMGILLQKTIEYFDQNNATSWELLQQFTYHGDPAVKIFASDGPDFVVDPASVEISPKNINVKQDSFTVSFSIINLGKNTGDSIQIEIEHELPDGTRFTAANRFVKSPAYSTKYEIKLSTVGKVAVGSNKLYITADATDLVPELPQPVAEMNNELTDASGQQGVRFFITDNSATPVYPSDFAIVGDEQVALRASTSDVLAPLASYIIEIDTTRLFNSPMKKSKTIEQTGGLIEWKPDFTFEDEKVYYWRISPDSINPEIGFTWEYRSFTYIKGSLGGWSQRHYWQFLENRMEDIELKEGVREFRFIENFIDFRIRNKIYDASDTPNGFVNGVRWSDFFRWQLDESMTVVVFDTLGQIWFNWNPGEYGSVNTNAARIGAYPFPIGSTAERENFINFINNVIPDNHWVIVYPARKSLTHDFNIDEWEADSLQLGGQNIFNVLEAQGAQQIRSLKDELVPYYFAFRKNQGSILEEKASSPEDVLETEIAITGFWHQGLVKSPLIGPAKEWESFQWQYDNTGAIDKDTFYVDVYGVAADQLSEVKLFEKQLIPEIELNAINVDSFPFLRLEFYAKDSIERSPVQLEKWSILFQGVPDVAFNPIKGFLFHKDTLAEGDNLRLESYVVNTNNLAMDSLLVRYEIRDKAGKLIQQDNRIGSLLPDGGLTMAFSYLTEGLTGDHQLLVQLNPVEDQQELLSFNNFLLKDFHVLQDRANPLLEVTFDGNHILDGDIVSSNPEISISLKDENPFLLLDDTTFYKLFLLLPNGNLQNIPLHGQDITFESATSSSNNRALLKWKPEFVESGEYTMIVQATDASGNNAGVYDYKVSFQVILETMLSNVMAYPNPFSTSTRFLYTLTGEPPTYFKIQIMTVSGKIVREITQDEIGPLKIGTHQTEFVWDGTDQFGDKLANGIYLYRVLARDRDQQDFKLFETGADGFFNEGFGKLAIIR